MPVLQKRPSLKGEAEGFWLWSGILFASFVFCYARVFAKLAMAWWSSYFYSYGFLIPVISLYIVWMQRDRLRKFEISPNAVIGGLVIIAGLALLVAGDVYGTVSLPGLSLVAMIAGLTLFVFGGKFLKALWFPIVYLLFMVPFWDNITNVFQRQFQNFSAALGSLILHAIGIPVYRESVYIELPNITLKVAKECSGVNNLIAVIAIAVPLAVLTLRSWRRRAVLVFGGIVISALYNSVRVASIGAFAYYGVSKALHGPFHMFQALYVSLIGFAGLFVLAWLLSRGDIKPEGAKPAAKKNETGYPGPGRPDQTKARFMAAAFVFVLLGIFLNFFFRVS